jgi:hypothetical protein
MVYVDRLLHDRCRGTPFPAVDQAAACVMHGMLLEKRQEIVRPAAGLAFRVSAIWIARPARAPTAGGKMTVCCYVIERGNRQLAQIVPAGLCSS